MKIQWKYLKAAPYAIALGAICLYVGQNHRVPHEIIIDKTCVIIEAHQSTIFKATGYSVGYPYAAVTKSGMPLVNKGFFSMGNLSVFTVAVDPKIIPLGSVLFIDDIGIAYCTDTGRDISGMEIDIAFASMKDAIDFGKKDVKVTLLRKGW